MPTFEVFPFSSNLHPSLYWSQFIVTPVGYAAITIRNTGGDAQERALSLAAEINTFLQTKQSIAVIREFLSNLDTNNIVSLLLVIPVEEQVLVAVKGRGTMLLKRQNKWIPILNSTGVLKGSLTSKDTILAITAVNKHIAGYIDRIKDVDDFTVLGKTVDLLLAEFNETASGILIRPEVKVETPLFNQKRHTKLNVTRVKEYLLQTGQNLRNTVSDRHNRIRIMAGLLGVGFFFSVVLGIYRQRTNETYQQLDLSYDQAQALFSEGIALMDRQPNDSKAKFVEAKKIIDTVLSQSPPKGKTTRNIQELSQKIADNLRIVSKIFPISLTEYFSMSLLREGRVIDTMTRVGDSVFFIDRLTGLLGGIAIPTKNADIISGASQLANAINLSGESDTLYVMTPEHIAKIKAGEKDPEIISVSYEGILSRDKLVHYGLNLYILDTGSRQLWRFQGDDKGAFAKPQPYFAEGVSPDVSIVTSVSIDGSVWFGTTVGKIYKYTQGQDDPFVTRGVDVPFGTKIYLYTSELSNFLYVLDPEQKRVVMLTKEGLYQAQYTWTEEINPTEIVVSEQQKRIILLANQKLFSFTLQ